MAFDWQVAAREATLDPFEFNRDGKRWRIPHPQDMVLGHQLALDGAQIVSVVRDLAERWNGKKWVRDGATAAAMFLESHPDDIAAFRVALLAHAGLKPGESGASST